jgi:hypothetical protein
MHAVWEQTEPPPETLWIHSHGMARFGLPDLEIVGVPGDLRGYAHGILFEILGYTKTVKPIRPDENFGGNFVGGDAQRVPHLATLRAVPDRDAEHAGLSRVVDLGASLADGFPRRLFAAHLCALGERTRGAKAVELFRRATEIFPGEMLDAGEGLDAEGRVDLQATQQRANLFAWEGLAAALVDVGATDEAIAALEQAVARCPAWARDYARFVTAPESPAPPDHPFTAFWRELDVDRVQSRVRGRVS